MLRPVAYECGDVSFTGFLADGSNGKPAPGVLVVHESVGVTEHVKGRALALAEQGYVAFALDLFGAHDLALPDAQRESKLVMRTPGLMHLRARAALDVLAAQPNVDAGRLGAIGFCLGGVVVLELARHRAPIHCAIGFHPGLKRPDGSPDNSIAAKVLMMIGDADPIVPQEDRLAFAQSMQAAGADWELHVFGGVGHSYTNPEIDAYRLPGFAYNAEASRRAWAMALELLREQLKSIG
ncbi:MAG: dienelactone hydrolase family protein [Proteobacteria bacterium]|nr:dienelactone hydrolase family protein [Pseudomonadota bacterium]